MKYLLLSIIFTIIALFAMAASVRRESFAARLATPAIFGLWLLLSLIHI